MIAGPRTFAYAQARLQARLGLRSESALRQAQAARDLASYLQQLRTTSRSGFVARLAPGMPLHELERRLRGEWVALVLEVARWQPVEWQPAIGWLRWLPWLPALQKIARAGRAPAWTRSDPALGSIVANDAMQGAQALPVSGLQVALRRNGDVVDAWQAQWRRAWPRDERRRAALEKLSRDMSDHRAALKALPPDTSSESARRVLAARLRRTLRNAPGSPAASVAWLGLEALDLLEVRGGVLTRAALGPVAELGPVAA
jgi:hypothetical protein